MGNTAKDIHLNFAQNLAYRDSIIWDAYTPQQFPLFRSKINELFRGQGCSENEIEKIRKNVYQNTINQSKYTNKKLLASFILVTVANTKSFRQAENATSFSVHLIIRTRKCKKLNDSSNCCMVFIDEMGNVYKDWSHFKETNCLPKGVAMAPRNGAYQFDNNTNLLLNTWMTPSSSLVSEAVEELDTAAGYGGLAAATGIVASMALPALLPAVPFFAAVCAYTGGYSALRSSYSLWSRSDHEQSIALTNASARGAWIGVASGALSVSSSVANKSLTKLAAAGKEVSLAREIIVNGMNISTMLLSGTGVAHGILDIILKLSDDEPITGLDVLQVASSLAIFTHSAYNFRLASTIVNQTRDSRVKAYRTELSNRQRKMFDKLYKETVRTQGTSKGKIDMIRLINEVPDRQYLNDMNKINKELNKNKIRVSAGQNGEILLNNDVQVKSGDLRNSVQHGKAENILSKVNQPIPDTHPTVPNKDTLDNMLTRLAFTDDINPLINYLEMPLQLILNRGAFQDCVRNIIDKVGDNVTYFLIQKAKEFIYKYGTIVENYLKSKLHLEAVLWDMFKLCQKELERITTEAIQKYCDIIFKKLLKSYEEMTFESPNTKYILCTLCGGYYQICSF